MTQFLKKRLMEKSSWYGLGALISGLGLLLKANYVPELGAIVTDYAEPLSQGDYGFAITAVVTGVLSMVTPDKGSK